MRMLKKNAEKVKELKRWKRIEMRVKKIVGMNVKARGFLP